MPNANRKWLPPALILIAVAASVVSYGRLPALLDIQFHGLLPFAVPNETELAPRWLALFFLPALALVLWAAFRAAPTAAGQRLARRMFRRAPEQVTSPDQFARFDKTYDLIVLGVVALVLGMHAALLAAAFQFPALASRIIPLALGAFLVLVGNVMPRLRANWVAGVRTSRTLADPQLWRSTHRAFGAAFVASGIVTLIVAVVAPSYGILTAIALLLVSLIVGAIASTRAGSSGGQRTLHAAMFAGGLLLGMGAAGSVSAQSVQPPAPATVAETPFTFTRDGLALAGTVAMPRASAGRIPVVLIVAGSGPTDRNANGPLINTNAYAMLAWGLADRGIASMRYDKRGIGASASATGDPTTLSIEDYVADVAAAAAKLAEDARFSRVFLLGHSEGAGHVLQAANRGAPAAGVVMVSPAGRRLTEILHEQFARQVDSATVVRIDSAFARFVRGDDPGDVPPIALPVMVPAYRNFLRSLAAYDPVAEARRYSGSLLILQGTTDVQVTIQDAELLHAAQPRATLVRLDGVNHVLKVIQSTDLNAQMVTYRDPSLALAPSVVPAIVRWIFGVGSSTSRP